MLKLQISKQAVIISVKTEGESVAPMENSRI